MADDTDKAIRLAALENAVKYKGKPNAGAVLGSVLSKKPELKDNKDEIAKLKKKVSCVADEIAGMSADEQQEELDRHAGATKQGPSSGDSRPADKDIFSFMDIGKGQEVITAFPPGPEKYPHIGHAKALLLNHMLAKKHKGRFILRFEDTNPGTVKGEFYDIMLEDFKWLGADWDELLYASDHMQLFLDKATELVESGQAYVCLCPADLIKEGRAKGEGCKCRDRSIEENRLLWSDFNKYEEGKAILRLKIDMEHKNSTMRDPAIFRIVEARHPRHGKRHSAWPTYDLQNSIMDGYSGVTHRLRSKEFEMRNELQRYIQKALGYAITDIYEFARFNMEGVLSSGRIIREKIASGELIGWDDPTLTTIAALRRRGFLPEAIRNFVISTGITKSESTLTWDDLIVQNRRLLDKGCSRYFFVKGPKRIRIEDAPEVVAEHKLHPEMPEKGTRALKSRQDFYIAEEDFQALEEGGLYRLMDCLNFTRSGDRLIFHSLEYSEYKGKGSRIMHYLPADLGLVKATVMMPDKQLVEGLAEPMVEDISEGSVVQFERFGFVRLDDKRKLNFWYTHK